MFPGPNTVTVLLDCVCGGGVENVRSVCVVGGGKCEGVCVCEGGECARGGNA